MRQVVNGYFYLSTALSIFSAQHKLGGTGMTFRKTLATASTALLVSLAPFVARAADKVVIGDIDDMSGVYADVNGPRAVEAIKMAIEDFGGSALGKPVDVLTFDHQ